MRAENYIAFFTVCGFFVGVSWTLIRATDPLDILVYTALITFFFYLVVHIVIMNYVDVKVVIKKFFDKEKHEEVADYLLSELAIREKRIENLLQKVDEQTSKKPLGKTNAKLKAKAA
ncbi:hypothetical protein [Campylobacter majalis]|uniref:hypothetical protein n=1 Tax=Campylobacter majalis TaxID=2790656 RepID=UPI003D69D2DE